jgi:hypothetical protein
MFWIMSLTNYQGRDVALSPSLSAALVDGNQRRLYHIRSVLPEGGSRSATSLPAAKFVKDIIPRILKLLHAQSGSAPGKGCQYAGILLQMLALPQMVMFRHDAGIWFRRDF